MRKHTDQLSTVPGIELAPPVHDVDLAVAEGVLSRPLPPALVEFLKVCDGARVGELEIFSAEGVVEATNAGAHSWQLPGAVVIGSAGADRALVMTGVRDEVCEVDEDPWESSTMELAADTPLDLFVRHCGLPLRARERWWAYPSLGAAIEESRRHFGSYVEALLEGGIGARVGKELAPSLTGFKRADLARAGSLLVAAEFEDQLLNHRPEPPMPGPCVRVQWGEACEAILEPGLRERVRAAPVSGMIPGVDRPVDGDLTLADVIRSHAFLALLAEARDQLGALATGESRARLSPAGQLAQVYLAGHVPVSFDLAI